MLRDDADPNQFPDTNLDLVPVPLLVFTETRSIRIEEVKSRSQIRSFTLRKAS